MFDVDADSVLVTFARHLRDHEIRVGAGQIIRFIRAANQLEAAQVPDLYWAGRLSLVNRADDLPTYDAVFRSFFEGSEEPTPRSILPVAAADDGAADASSVIERGSSEEELAVLEEGDAELRSSIGQEASSAEVLRTKHFDQWTNEELRRLHRMVPRLAVDFPHRRSRRMRPTRRGESIDIRKTMRASLRQAGEVVELRWRARIRQPRHLVMLVDVSGSMAGFSRALVQVAYSARRASSRVEVFCFGTRLTRVTDALKRRDPDLALAEASQQVVDWDGGTRIGESIRSYVDRWGHYQFNRGAVVIICSDGLERGEPDLLAAATARLSRQVHAIIWVNPLKGDPSFQPLARGLVAALPHVNALVAGHNIEGLEGLFDTLADIG